MFLTLIYSFLFFTLISSEIKDEKSEEVLRTFPVFCSSVVLTLLYISIIKFTSGITSAPDEFRLLFFVVICCSSLSILWVSEEPTEKNFAAFLLVFHFYIVLIFLGILRL